MDDSSRRRLLATAATALGTLLAGCATGGDGTTRTTRTTRPTAATTAEQTTTTTAEETTTTTAEETSTTTTTTAEQTTSTTPESTTTTVPDATVTVGPGGDFVFDPGTVTVSPGATVEWRWDSGGHNVVVESQPEGADWNGTDGGASTTYGEGHAHSFAFEVAGTYEYHCAPHQSVGMRGAVVVE